MSLELQNQNEDCHSVNWLFGSEKAMVKRLGPMCGSFAISCRLLGKSKHKNKDGNNFNWQYLTGAPGGKGTTTLWRIVLASLKMKKLGLKRVSDEPKMTHLEDGEPGPNPGSLNRDHQKASICGLRPRYVQNGRSVSIHWSSDRRQNQEFI